MALRDRRTNIFSRLGCLVASTGLVIWVSSISFKKSNIGWPQQPPKEKGLKFNITFFMILPNSFFSQNIKNKAEFKDLDHSEVLRTSAASMTSTTSMASMTSTVSFLLILMVGSSLVPKWPILAPFCGIDNQNYFFLLIYHNIPVGGRWG